MGADEFHCLWDLGLGQVFDDQGAVVASLPEQPEVLGVVEDTLPGPGSDGLSGLSAVGAATSLACEVE